MADFEKVQRNIRKMLSLNAPESDIDAYIAEAGVTQQQLRMYGAAKRRIKEADRSLGRGGVGDAFSNTIARSATLGLADEAAAVGRGTFNYLRGTEPGASWSDHYLAERAAEKERGREEGQALGVAELPTRLAGGAALMPARAAQAVVSGAPWLLDAVKAGVAWGGGAGVIDSHDPSLSGRMVSGAKGAAAGAAFAPALVGGSRVVNRLLDPAAGNAAAVTGGAALGAGVGAFAAGDLTEGGAVGGAVGAVSLGLLKGRARLRERQVERGRRVSDEAAQWVDEGITPYGPALTESPIQRAIARDATGGVLGGAHRRAARETADEIAANVDARLGGQTTAEAGRRTQEFLRRNLEERSIPHDEIATMTRDDLERLAPYDPATVQPPKPSVVPETPQAVKPYPPAPYEKVEPSPYVQRFKETPRKTMDDVRGSPDAERRLSQIDAEIERFSDVQRRFPPGGILQDQSIGTWYRHRDWADAEKNLRSLRTRRERVWRRVSEERSRALADENAQIDALNARNRQVDRDQYEKTEVLRAEQENARRARQAEIDAETKTRAAQDAEAQRAQQETARKQADIDQRYASEAANYEPRFRVGASRQTYPTEADASFELARRSLVSKQDAPEGERFAGAYQRALIEKLPKNPRTGKYGKPTATYRVLDDVFRQSRGDHRLSGLKTIDDALESDAFWRYLGSKIGTHNARNLRQDYVSGTKGQFAQGPEGHFRLRTELRYAEGGPAIDKAIQKRLQAAITDDIERAATEAGQVEYARLTMSARKAYEQLKTDIQAPLERIIGERVPANVALDRLVAATRPGGDAALLSTFYRVVKDKGSHADAAGWILSRAIEKEGGGAIGVARAIRGLSPEARSAMFSGDAAELGRSLDRLAAMAERMRPFVEAAERGQRLNLGLGSNWLHAVWAFSHWPTALASAGGSWALARFMASPLYVDWLSRMPRAAQRGGPALEKWLTRMTALAAEDQDMAAPALAASRAFLAGFAEFGRKSMDERWKAVGIGTDRSAAVGLAPGEPVFSTLESPPTSSEVDNLAAKGARIFDIDVTQPGAEASVAAIKAKGGEVTAYHVGGGGGRAWGSVKAGEGVRKFMTAEDLDQLKGEVEVLVARGASNIHFDNTHRLSGKRLEAVADAIIAGGARIVPKNNAEKWILTFKRRPDLLKQVPYAIMEDTVGDAWETAKAKELSERGVPVYVVAFGRKIDGSAGPSEAATKAWATANPWARAVWMPDEKAFDGRTGKRIGGPSQ